MYILLIRQMIQLRFLFSLNQKMVFEAVKFVSATKIREKHKFSPIVGDLYEVNIIVNNEDN